MSQIVEQLARQDLQVAAVSSFDISHPKSELRRLTEQGTLVRLTHGFYALVPESQRGPSTSWHPTVEGMALGVAVAIHGIESVALVGPSAARALDCYPRALATGFVAVPIQRRPRSTAYGKIRFISRDVSKLDTVRVETDLGPGWATSPEQTALDLVRNWPAWEISESTRDEMIQRLAARIDWEIIDDVARQTRSVQTLVRLRRKLEENRQ